MSPKSKIEITSESDFREKAGLTEPVTLEWKEGQVIASTQDALDTLKKNMEGQAAARKRELAEEFIRANEKKNALDTLTDKLGESVLKNPAVLAAAGTAVAGVGVVVNEFDKKAKEVTGEDVGFMDSIRDWLKEARDESNGFMKGLWSLLLKLFGGGETNSLDSHSERDKSIAENTSSRPNESVTKATVAILAKVSPALLGRSELYKDQKNVSTILTMPKVLDAKYNDLQVQFQKYNGKNPAGIGAELGISSYKDIEIYDALFLLFSDEKLFASLFAGDKGDISWKQKPMYELFHMISDDVKIFDRMENAAKAATAGEFEKLLGTEDESEGMQFQDGNFAGDMKEKFDKMMQKYQDKGLTIKVAGDIMMNPESLTDATMKERGYSEKELSFVHYLRTYAGVISTILSSDSYGGNKSEIGRVLNTKPLTLKESFRFFMNSSDAQSIEEMNVFAQYKAYGYIRSILKVRGDNGALAGYDLFLFEETKNVVMGAPSKLPVGVQRLTKQMTKGAENMAKNWLEENMSYGWELIKKKPELAGVAIAIVAGTFVLGRVVFAGKVAMVTLLTLLAGIATTLGLGQIGKSLDSESAKYK